MKGLALLIAAIALSTACGKANTNSSDFIYQDSDKHQKTVNETDTSACAFGRRPTNLEGGKWQIFLRNGDIRFTTIFEFSNRRLWVSNTCHFPNHTVTAYVSSPVSETSPGVLLIENNVEKTEQTTDSSGRQTTCSASLKRVTASYRFKGSCLELQAQGSTEVATFVPFH